jgi:hypothetical protein
MGLKRFNIALLADYVTEQQFVNLFVWTALFGYGTGQGAEHAGQDGIPIRADRVPSERNPKPSRF